MNLSFGEYRALVAKAMRGAGYSWGLTEDGSFAAKRLAEFGLSSGDMIVRLLHEVDGQAVAAFMPNTEWTTDAGQVCPISLGTSIADGGGCEELTVHGVLEPLLIVPAMGASCRDGLGYVMSWVGGECHFGRQTLTATGVLPVGAVEISLRSAPIPRDERQPRSTRVLLDEDIAGELACFAHRVYAPATDESRAGAGAGLSDND